MQYGLVSSCVEKGYRKQRERKVRKKERGNEIDRNEVCTFRTLSPVVSNGKASSLLFVSFDHRFQVKFVAITIPDATRFALFSLPFFPGE